MAKIQKVPLTAPDVSSKVKSHGSTMKSGMHSGGHNSPTPEEIASKAKMPAIITSMTAK